MLAGAMIAEATRPPPPPPPPPRPIVVQQPAPVVVQQPAPIVVQQPAPVVVQPTTVYGQPAVVQQAAVVPAAAPPRYPQPTPAYLERQRTRSAIAQQRQTMRVAATVPGGSTMTLQTPDGRQLSVVVPAGVQVGQSFEFGV